MRIGDNGKTFVVDDDLVLPIKFAIVEGHDYGSMHFGREMRQETRVVRCYFENRWALSIIWGSMTYSDNKDHPWGNSGCGTDRVFPEFVEEPFTVEVGIIMPEVKVRPATKIDVSAMPGYKGPAEIPEREYELWGDPLGWVDAEGLRFLVNTVAHFDSHNLTEPEAGPYLERDDTGRYRLAMTYESADETAD